MLNWLGSPQTALTATIFNFRQIRDSHRRAQRRANTLKATQYNAAYFVLSCINQFDGLKLGFQDDAHTIPDWMLSLLVYGLFRPVSRDKAPNGQDKAQDIEATEKLLAMLAFQLRMLRRRGVIPMLASLGVFLIAFIFSVILTFAELGSGSNSFSFSLAFGLLMTWLPLLVVFSIVDRNPVSSERSA